MNHHFAAQLASERFADLHSQPQPRPQRKASELPTSPVQKVARQRVDLPLKARGLAGPEDLPPNEPAMTMTNTPRRRVGSGVARLVEAAAGGDQRSWDELVSEYSGMVWAITRAHRLNHADAADVAQATWIHLLKNIGRLTQPGLVGAWLATTARRECLRVLRARQRELLIGDDFPEIAADEPEPADGLTRAERSEVLRRALGRLSHSDQALLRMLTTEPAPTYREISAAPWMIVGDPSAGSGA